MPGRDSSKEAERSAPAIERFLDYLLHEKRFSPHTVKAYRTDISGLSRFLHEVFEGTLNRAEGPQLRSWLAECLGKGMSPRTLKRKLSSARTYYKWRRKLYPEAKDPTFGLTAPKTGSRLPKFVDEDLVQSARVEALHQASDFDPRTVCMIDMLYQTGIRSAELIGLTLADVDLEGAQMTVLGKRSKERVLPLSPSLVGSMRSYLLQRRRIDPPSTVGAFFVTDKGAALYPKYLYRTVNSYLKTIGAGSFNGPHILRHTFATHMLNRGADITSIKELLGHASLAATQVYTHNDIGRLMDVHKKNHPKG